MINAAGRFIPEEIPGLGRVRPYEGPFAYQPQGRLRGPKIPVNMPKSEKLLSSIDQAIEACGLRDGMTISFHHHFRNIIIRIHKSQKFSRSSINPEISGIA